MIKKILFSLVIAFFVVKASAQVVSVIDGSKKTFFLSATDPSDCKMHFTNVTGKSTVLAYTKVFSDFPFGWSVSLCDNRNCHNELVQEDSFAAMNKDEQSEFKISIDPSGKADTSTVIYTIYDRANPSKKDTLEFRFVLQWGAGLAEKGKVSHQIYPNPANGVLHITNLFEDADVAILSLDGRFVKSVKVKADDNSINITDLPKGLYYLSYGMNGELYRNSFIKL